MGETIVNKKIFCFDINNDTWQIEEKCKDELLELYKKECKEDDIYMVYGVTKKSNQIIYINSEMSEQQKRKTLMHELMHCYLYEFGIHNFLSFDEEDLCNFSAHSHDIIHKIVKDYYTYKFIE